MVAIIIVSWNVKDLLRACLQSLARHASATHIQQVIVVDNASGDGTASMVRGEFPSVCLVKNQTNRGFTGGNNDGIRIAEQWFSTTFGGDAYVFLLNPDTVVTEGALDNLLAYADAHPQVGLLGPQLLHPDGTIQSSRRRFPTLLTALVESTWLQPYAPHRLLDSYYMRDLPDQEPTEVDWLYGAAMLVRRAAYRQVGTLDERTFFMYSEEVDWCKRLKDSGWQVAYCPAARVVHYEGQSSVQVSARRMIHFNTSKVRYFRKHHGTVQATLLRAGLLAQFTLQIIVEGSKWLVGHKRSLRAERVRAYTSVLASGLR